jgi:AsmA protein
MLESNSTHDLPAVERAPVLRRRLIGIAAAVLVLLLALLLPPYINVSRYQHQVASNISAALGRPVHFDNITLDLLPLPGFTLQNFVVEEDPAFGSEPILRSNEVRVNIRLQSLWTRRVEFSRIVLTDPSVNLVHISDGRWNIESLFLQAAHTEAAPTAQTYSGPAPRFPYIEATGARLNLKLDQVKAPLSLTDADFALWLPEPRLWRLRVEAHPTRTDSSPANTGDLRLEATLGSSSGAPASSLAQVPIDLHGDWKQVQLGGLSRLLIADDAGLRGELALTFHLLGTLGENAIAANLSLDNARRADFVPPHPLSIVADCRANAQNTFHTLSNVECHWPPSSSGPGSVTLTANLPDLHHPGSASVALAVPSLPAATFFDWLSVATRNPPTGFTGPGTLSANLVWNQPNKLQADATSATAPSKRTDRESAAQSPSQPVLTGEMEFIHESLLLPALGSKPISLGDLLLRPTVAMPVAYNRSGHAPPPAATATTSFDLSPVSLPLGGKQPAVLEGRFDATGYTLHLTGSALPARLLALGDAIPQIGDGLRPLLEPTSGAPSSAQKSSSEATEPIHLDLTATRQWGGPQIWRQTAAPVSTHPHHRAAH